jgi:ribonuclease HII
MDSNAIVTFLMPVTLLPRKDYKFFESQDYSWIVGLDEAGAGCLAGPLYVGAFVLPKCEVLAKKSKLPERIVDSKILNEEIREKSFEFLQTIAGTQNFVKIVSVENIEEKNIYWARMEAFLEFVLELDEKLESKCVFVVDGPRLSIPTIRMQDESFRNRWEKIEARVFAFPKADGKYFSVAAASIVAKVSRDRFMRTLANDFPEYNWKSNKGYSTADHWVQIHKAGLTPHHRNSFVKKYYTATEDAKQAILEL